MRACDSKEAKAIMKQCSVDNKTIESTLEELSKHGFLDRNYAPLSYQSTRRLALNWGIKLKGMRYGKVPAVVQAVDVQPKKTNHVNLVMDILTSNMTNENKAAIFEKLIR